jgi:hypothetical protein
MGQQRMIGNRHQPPVIDQRAHRKTGFFWGQSRIQRLRLVGHNVRQNTAFDRADRERLDRLTYGAAPIMTFPAALCATIPPGWDLPPRLRRAPDRGKGQASGGINRADSIGVRKELGELFGWFDESERLAGPVVEAGRDAGEVGGGVDGQVGAFGQVLAQ